MGPWSYLSAGLLAKLTNKGLTSLPIIGHSPNGPEGSIMAEPCNTGHIARGIGWLAIIEFDHIELRIDPRRDPIVEAIRELLAPDQRRYWTLELMDEDQHGRLIYRLEREPISLV